jgi:hypothetical protein
MTETSREPYLRDPDHENDLTGVTEVNRRNWQKGYVDER